MMSDEPTGFEGQLKRGLIFSTQNIELEGRYTALEDDTRERTLNQLSYAFWYPNLWPETYRLIEVMIPKMEMAGHRQDWVPYLEKGDKIGQQQHDITGCGEISLAVGYLKYQLANYPQARVWFERSRKCFQQIGDEGREGKALNRLAMIQMRRHKYQCSKKLVGRALKLLAADDADRANSYYVLGAICHDSEEWKQAESHFRRSLNVWEEIGDLRRIAWGLRNLGPALARQEKYQEAEDCYTRALAIFDEVHDPTNRAMTLVNLANLYSKFDRIAEAAEFLISAHKIFKMRDDHLNLAITSLNLGRNLAIRGNHTAARISYHESIQLWDRLEDIASLCNALDCLGESYLDTHEYADATAQFEYALARILEIEDHPRYDRLNKMLSEHLVQAQERE